MDRLELIVKLTERCNIACTYCYYFENDDKSAFSRPHRLTDEAAERLVFRVDQALRERHFDKIRVIFHGGEPLMYGKNRFRDLCQALKSLEHGEKLSLCIQTNATLIDHDWVDIFRDFGVAVGVSIDGPPDIHNRHRIDKRGRPTFHLTEAGIKQLLTASREGHLVPPSALVVMQSCTDPKEIFDYIAHSLGILEMDFLLPDATWESRFDTNWVGDFLVGLFQAWCLDGSKTVNVRLIKSTISLLSGGKSYLGGYGPERATALTILADGEINGDDFLRPCGDELLKLGLNLFSSPLIDAVCVERKQLAAMQVDCLPDLCVDCAFEHVCCGGQLTHRYSKLKGFNNPTIYCNELKKLFVTVCKSLVVSNVSLSQIERVLRGTSRKPLEPQYVPTS